MGYKLPDAFSPLRKDWIRGAIKRPGAFRKKAEAHDMSTKAFANEVIANKDDYSTLTGQQAELAHTLMGMNMNSPLNKHDEIQAEIDAAKAKWDKEKPEGDFYETYAHLYEAKTKAEAAHKSSPLDNRFSDAIQDKSLLEEAPATVESASKAVSDFGSKVEETKTKRENTKNETEPKSRKDARISKTKEKISRAKKDASRTNAEGGTKESQATARAKAKRLEKRAKRQAGRAERKEIRKSNKLRENKRQAIIKSRRKQKES